MNNFSTLFKYELKKQFPIKSKKGKSDFLGFLLSFLITAAIVGLFIFFVSIIAKNYVAIKVDKVVDTTARAYELLNLLYSISIVAMTFICLEQMRRTLTDKSDKKALLRLPVSEQTLFLSKFSVLLLQNYIVGFLFVVPINIIIFLVTQQSIVFWLMTFVVWLVLPVIVCLIASILVVPYIKLIDIIKTKYAIMFLLLTILLSGLFILYVLFLTALQGYLETGFIKFLFNEDFINTLQTLTYIAYPANCLAGIVLNVELVKSILILLGSAIVATIIVYYVSKKLLHVTLYKDDNPRLVYKKSNNYKPMSIIASLMKKEFVSVAREPKHIFSYLVIAAAMPVMAYCCFTMLETLIYNMIGLKMAFPLGIFVVLIFSVLTNTFCSTNITREGIALLKQKTLPIKAKNILTAKVLFCFIVSLLAVIATSIVLIFLTSLNALDGLLCMMIGGLFSVAQILIATRLDLKRVNLSLSQIQIEKQSTRTITKVVSLGLIVAITVGVLSLLCGIFSQNVIIINNFSVHSSFMYLFPCIVCTLYFVFALVYYYRKIQYAFDNVSK